MFVEESITIQRVPPVGSTHTFHSDVPSTTCCQSSLNTDVNLPTLNDLKYSKDGRYVIKRSKTSLQYEVELVNWLGRNTTIPAPRVSSHTYDERLEQFIAIFEIPMGRPLSECWGELSPKQKELIISELKAYLNQLRSITTSQMPNLFTRDRFLDSQDGVMSGPFDSTGAFLDAIASRIDRIGSLYDPGQTKKALRFLSALRDMPTGQDMVFTHGNICPDNILVDQSGKIAAILDWSESGYAPSFWEYVKANIDDDDCDFYLEGVPDCIMEPCPVPLSIMIHAHRIIW